MQVPVQCSLKQTSRYDSLEGIVWAEPVATSKLLDSSHSPHQRKFCTEGGPKCLCMLGEHHGIVCMCIYPHVCACTVANINRERENGAIIIKKD